MRPVLRGANSKPVPAIALITDFGLRDGYAAIIRGVAMKADPEIRVVDITHQIPSYDINSASFVLANSINWFPADTVYVVVVDPGVGSERLPIILQLPSGQILVGPDNGVFTSVIAPLYPAEDTPLTGVTLNATVSAAPPAGVRAWHIKPAALRSQISSTFHARDVFMPAAAAIASGEPPASLGEPLGKVHLLDGWLPERESGGIAGRVIYTDKYGNLITNVHKELLAALRPEVEVHIGDRRITGLSSSYQQCSELGALIGSHGYLEIAAYIASAAERTRASAGSRVSILVKGDKK